MILRLEVVLAIATFSIACSENSLQPYTSPPRLDPAEANADADRDAGTADSGTEDVLDAANAPPFDPTLDDPMGRPGPPAAPANGELPPNRPSHLIYDLDCADSWQVTGHVGEAVFNGTTNDAGSTYDGSCVPHRALSDRVLIWKAPIEGFYEFRVTGSNGFAPAIYVLDGDCDEGAQEIACSVGNSVRALLQQDQKIRIVVDGATPGETGDFVIHITPPSDYVAPDAGPRIPPEDFWMYI